MNHSPIRRIIPVLLLVGAVAAIAWYLNNRSLEMGRNRVASGTIEAVEVRISPEIGGRIVEITAGEGERVQAGQVLVRLDPVLLAAQRDQAAAGLAAAQANLALLEAGPSAEQERVAFLLVEQARVARDSAREAFNDLPEGGEDTPAGKDLRRKVQQAEVALDTARAQLDQLQAGARAEQIEAARAQVNAARAGLAAVEAQIGKLNLSAPLDGVVLQQVFQPGELAQPGATVLVLAQMDDLTLTIYVPEDQYGQVRLGQRYPVTVDSFPGESFGGRVVAIADQAEYTPRNVQTSASRKTTVFAVRLALDPAGGKLKPGMPADVDLAAGE